MLIFFQLKLRATADSSHCESFGSGLINNLNEEMMRSTFASV